MDFGSVEVVVIAGVAEMGVCGFCEESGELWWGSAFEWVTGYIWENSTGLIACQLLFTMWVFE